MKKGELGRGRADQGQERGQLGKLCWEMLASRWPPSSAVPILVTARPLFPILLLQTARRLPRTSCHFFCLGPKQVCRLEGLAYSSSGGAWTRSSRLRVRVQLIVLR